MPNPIILGADAVRSELTEAPEAHDLTRAQAERVKALTDDEINTAIHSALDDYFYDAYDSVRRNAIAALAKDPLVCVVFLQGQDYNDAVDAANETGGSTEAVVKHLAQWDFGDETDGAATVNGHTDLTELEHLPHQLHEVDHGGLHYWLQLDHRLGIYGLYRRPLSTISSR